MNVPFTKVLKQNIESTWTIESVVGKREYFVEKSQDHPSTEKSSCRLSCLDCMCALKSSDVSVRIT